jgi:hydroxypyruvate reductase
MQRELLVDLYQAAIAAVDSRHSVKTALEHFSGRGPVEVVALGKAGIGMSRGAMDTLGERIRRGLIVSKTGCGAIADPRFECLEAGHPVPDRRSLEAGRRLLEFIDESPPDADVLFLISGGASALVEAPAPGVALAEIVEINQWLLGSGLDIGAMNAMRRSLSRIKGGGLLRHLGRRRALALYISDVAGDRIADIGSGPLGPVEARPVPPLPEWIKTRVAKARQPAPDHVDARIDRRIVARLDDAMAGAADAARARGYAVFVHDDRLEGEADQAGARIAQVLADAPAGVHIWGGETVVTLPHDPGRGGRNQELALAAAIRMRGRGDVALLAAGTDGIDGPGDAAGAIVDGGTVARGEAAAMTPQTALAEANSGAFLEASGDLLMTGPTGTNVTDIVLALKEPEDKASR